MTTTDDKPKRERRAGNPDGPLAFARRLRRDMTMPERLLWQALRSRRCAGLKFRRQVPMSGFVLDFFDPEHKLVVEVDGLSHDGRGEPDRARQRELERRGLTVIRVSNDEVLRDVAEVVEGIASCASRLRAAAAGSPPLFPSPLVGEGGRRPDEGGASNDRRLLADPP